MSTLRHRLVQMFPDAIREPLRRLLPGSGSTGLIADEYAARIEQENQRFANDRDVHALPAIYHYWSNKYLLPMELEFGARHPEDFLATYLHAAVSRTGSARPRFVSLGAGNCDAEVRIAQALVERGLADFTLECLDINPAMIDRGRALAAEAGVGHLVVPVCEDLNQWRPARVYDGVMANQSLHHMVALESLFDAVHGALLDARAAFVISDMIGRNGHQRWPEALAIVREYWRELPPSYRFNLQLQREEPQFLDWDCSVEGFEGIRSQDILPLLLERFGFEVFLGFANVIDPFIDRGFGHHFDPSNPRDLAFIDKVHARDEAEMAAGTIKPTHMLAVLSIDPGVTCRYRGNLSPRASVRSV